MSDIREIIRQIHTEQACPICHSRYPLDQIRFRGTFGQTLVIQTVCKNGHITLFMTLVRLNQYKQVSANDVLDLSEKLNNFNGDFEKLWKKSF